VIGLAARLLGRRLSKSQRGHIELVDEGVDDPNEVVLRNEIIERFAQKCQLLTGITLYVSHKKMAASIDAAIFSDFQAVFTQPPFGGLFYLIFDSL
jgi:hypothetical protein